MNTYAIVCISLCLLYLVAKVEFASMLARRDRLKRGIKLFSEPLPEDMRLFFTELTDDYVEVETGAFIRKQSGEILVQYLQYQKYVLEQNCLAYVAWTDLAQHNPRLEYRVPFSFLLLIALWLALVVQIRIEEPESLLIWGTFVVVLYLSFRYQKWRIAGFVKRASQTVHSLAIPDVMLE